jgi:hypothetical protein
MMTRRRARGAGELTIAVLLAISAARSTAVAAPGAPDTAVTTRDGSAYQGVLVEQVPGDHITIQMADGTIHTFVASQVASVHPLGARPPMPPVQPLAPAPPGVLVDFTATDQGARLVQASVTGNAVPSPNPELCGPPCRVRVAPGNYLIGGPGIVPSAGFALTGNPDHVRVTSDVLTTDRRGTSQFLMIGGGIGALAVGLPVWMMGYVFEAFQKDNQALGVQTSTDNAGPTLVWIGLSVTALCVGAVIAGLAMYRGDTTVHVDPAGP